MRPERMTRDEILAAVHGGRSLSGANLRWVDLRQAILDGANLHGANLHGADLGDANLRGADLREADLSATDLGDANLRGANLRGANLEGADLHGADLCEVNLSGADLRLANLDGTALYWANLSGADLYGANLRALGILTASGLPSGPAALIPTPNGWWNIIGCWDGTPEQLRTMLDGPDELWPEARGDVRTWRQPSLEAWYALCVDYMARHVDTVPALAERWGVE